MQAQVRPSGNDVLAFLQPCRPRCQSPTLEVSFCAKNNVIDVVDPAFLVTAIAFSGLHLQKDPAGDNVMPAVNCHTGIMGLVS